MKYVKYSNLKGTLQEGEILLMSHSEFVNGGKDVFNVRVCVTQFGEEPIEAEW